MCRKLGGVPSICIHKIQKSWVGPHESWGSCPPLESWGSQAYVYTKYQKACTLGENWQVPSFLPMTDPFETGSVKREKKLAFTNNVAISRHFAYAYRPTSPKYSFLSKVTTGPSYTRSSTSEKPLHGVRKSGYHAHSVFWAFFLLTSIFQHPRGSHPSRPTHESLLYCRPHAQAPMS